MDHSNAATSNPLPNASNARAVIPSGGAAAGTSAATPVVHTSDSSVSVEIATTPTAASSPPATAPYSGSDRIRG
ncbi:MAG: hypothetical protein EOP68_22805 [Sphingomonas sp.]|nr:MAG: hypothetical protein EOP68_22805 [Sphingomonas sp.]